MTSIAVRGHEETPAESLTVSAGVTPAMTSLRLEDEQHESVTSSKNTSNAAELSSLAGHELDISTAPRRNSEKWSQGTITWGEILSWMQNPADHKECGNYLLGRLKSTGRSNDDLLDRCALTLDADSPKESFLADLDAVLGGYAYVIHTTFKSTLDAPRYRVIVPLAGRVSSDVYRRSTRAIHERVGQEHFDNAGAKPAQYMFKPSEGAPGLFRWKHFDGKLLDAQDFITEDLADEGPAGGELVSTSAPSPAPSANRDVDAIRAYLKSAVDGEALELSDLGEGEYRNNRLNDAALKLGHYAHYADVVPDIISEGAVWAELDKACHDNGLIRKDGTTTTHGTFLSGWRKGQREPVDIEPRLAKTTQRTGAGEDSEDHGGNAGGWGAIDLTPFLDGSYSPPEPTILSRTDGKSLLYRGYTHSLHGESESGKSMIAQSAVVELLSQGESVLYLDYEADAGSVMARLIMMGAPVDRLSDERWFIYRQPERDYAALPESRVEFSRLLNRSFALVVIDGVNEALTQFGGAARSTGGLGGNDDVTAWHDHLPRPLARYTGAAVVQIDHVAKEGETRFAIGGQAKMATITGAAYVVKPLSKIAKDAVGETALYVAKDRHGTVRGYAEGEYNLKSRLQLVATAVVDGRNNRLHVELRAPLTSDADQHLVTIKEDITAKLAGLPEGHKGQNVGWLRENVTGKGENISAALDELVRDGYVHREVRGRGKFHTFKKQFINPDDFSGPLEDIGREDTPSPDLGELI